MRILFVHNNYGTRSGEEIMLDRIIDLLRAHGHEVGSFLEDSARICGITGQIGAAMSGIHSVSACRRIRERVSQFRPDLVQVQNLYPLISPAVLPIIRQMGVPVVMRLSNYRLVCPNGQFLSHGRPCHACSGGREWNCVVRNCESSLFKSTAYAARNAWARKRRHYLDNVTRYYAQTAFQREVLLREGYPADRIDVISNMIDRIDSAADPDAVRDAGAFVGFVGRLSAEKGVETLLNAAARLPDIPFRLAGDSGAWAGRVDLPANVILLGRLDRAALADFYRAAALIVVPSMWYEGFPSVIIEAMSHHRAVVVSEIGGLPEIVGGGAAGVTVPPGEAAPLAEAVAALWRDPARRQALGRAGAERVRREYSAARYYERLMATYGKALA